jgi:hypothetical protein
MSESDGASVTFDAGDGDEKLIFEDKLSKVSGMLEEEVLEKVLDQFGELSQWKCAVYHKKDGIAQTTLVGNYDNDIPDPEAIGNRCGGGKIRYLIRGKNKGKKVFGEFSVHLDSSFDLEAEKYRIAARREMVASQPAQNPGDESTKALVTFAMKSMELSQGRPDNSLQLFQLILEQNAKSEERISRILEKLGERSKEPSMMERLNEFKALKEMGLFGSEGGGDSKGTVAQILEVLAPVAQTIIETMGGRGARPPESAIGTSASGTSEPDEPPPPSLDALAQEIVAKIDKWLGIFFPISTGSTLKDKVELAKANVARNTARNNPEIRKLLSSENHVRYIRENIGEEKFAKLAEVFK